MIRNKSIGGILLIAGTCIGAGMLALPLTSAPSGFLYSILLLAVCWFFMYVTGLYVLEVTLSVQGTPSFISMAKATLGKWGEVITWLGFLLLLYSLLAAYVTATGDLVNEISQIIFNKTFPQWLGILLGTLPFAFFVFLGIHSTDYVNRFFMIGLIIAYVILIVIASPHIKSDLLFTAGESKYLMAALPVVFTGLGYHIIVPSVCRYLDYDTKAIRRTIFWGSFIPFVSYVAWEAIVFGIIPLMGENSLFTILHSGHQATGIQTTLHNLLQNPWITTATRCFIFFAIASSFVGVAFGLSDLLADGCSIERTPKGRAFLSILTFVPPLIFAFSYPKGFILALTYAGTFVAIIHGLLPALMALNKRRKALRNSYEVAGGKILLGLTSLFFVLVIYFDIAGNMGWIPTLTTN